MSLSKNQGSSSAGKLPKSVSELLVEWPFLAKDGVAPTISTSTDSLIEFWGWVTEMRWCNNPGDEYPVCEPGIGLEVTRFPCLCPGYDHRGVEITDYGAVVPAQQADNVVVCVNFAP